MVLKFGFIYILSNQAFNSHLLKIGKTTRSIEQRVQELSSDTGVPIDFNLEFAEWVCDVHRAEVAVHESLDKYRINKKEFFKVKIKTAKNIIRNVCDKINSKNVFDCNKIIYSGEIARIIDDQNMECPCFDEHEIEKLLFLVNNIENTIQKAMVYYLLAQCYFENGEVENALFYYKESLSNSNHYDLSQSIKVEGIQYKKGRCYLSLGKLKQACYCFKRSHYSLETVAYCAETKVLQGELREAVSIYKEFLAKDKTGLFCLSIKPRMNELVSTIEGNKAD